MNLISRRFQFALITGVLAFGLCPARADDADMVKEKLFQAKKEYDAKVLKFKMTVTDLLDKKEVDARKAGDKKLLDQIKAERDAFEKTGESPQLVSNAMREPVTATRTKLDKAYSAAIKEYVRLKMDEAAGVTDKEQQEFRLSSALLFGKRIYVSSLNPIDIKVWNNWFEKDASKYKMDGDAVPHSIFMHPDVKATASVSYPLPPKAVAFRASVGVPKHAEIQGDPASALTFEVLGDGKSLWKSEPVTKNSTFQTCTVKLDKVKTLTLCVHCSEAHGGAHAVWFGPVVVE